MLKLQNQKNKMKKYFERIDIDNIKKFIYEKDQKLSEHSTTITMDTDTLEIKTQDSKKDNINIKKSFHEIDNKKDEKEEVSKELNGEKKKIIKFNFNFTIPINDLNNENKKIDTQYYIRLDKKEKEENKKQNNICINLKVYKEDELNQQKRKIQNLKTNENKAININSQNIFINQNLNQIPYNGINNKLIGNQVNVNFYPFYAQNNLVGLNNNQNIYNSLLYKINLYLNKKKQEKKELQKLKDIGFYGINNSHNKNHYLTKMFLNNNLDIINNTNNLNPLFTFNNPLNQINYNYYGNQNQLLNNYIINPNLLNINGNGLNNINNLNNLNNISGQNIPEQYTIIIKNNTKDPEVKKLSKIKVTTTYLKDKTKNNQENKEQNNKVKSHKNFINIDDIISGKENRTVVRLNPIPPNYSSFDISKLLDKYLNIESGKNQRIYKAIYTPLCKIIGKNLGYCFIMMANPKYVIDFYNTFNGRIFQKKKCKRPCNVIWADIQGNEFLKTNEDDPIRKPIIFKDIKND